MILREEFPDQHPGLPYGTTLAQDFSPGKTRDTLTSPGGTTQSGLSNKKRPRFAPEPRHTFQLLPGQPQSQLHLPRIERRRVLTRKVPERIHVGRVVLVDDVKNIDDPIQLEPFGEIDAPRHSHICKEIPRTHSGVAAEIAEELSIESASRDEPAGSRKLGCNRRLAATVRDRSARHDRSIRRRAEIEVLVDAGNDVERTSRSNLDDRRNGPVAKQLVHEPCAQVSGHVNAADDEPVPLIK